MRQLLALLLLTTGIPALAADPESDTSTADSRVEMDRPVQAERTERPRMFDRVLRAEREARDGSLVRPQVDAIERQEPPERAAPPLRERRVENRERPVAEERRERIGDRVREWRWRERNAERARRVNEVPPATVVPPVRERLARPDSVAPPVGAAPRERDIGRTLRNRIATEGWRREWREDRRFDWRRQRDWDRDRFRVGFYHDPFGWNYRRWHVGRTLHPRYLSNRFWINDPFHYRLPPVYGPYRWVRYWDDALLVDLRTGRVVDVIHNFFW
jgi:Ni/Co efflux regulator RcnB